MLLRCSSGLASICAATIGATACGGNSPAATLYGEVHIHQFAGGVHAAASFISPSVPEANIKGDSLISWTPTPRATQAGCTLTDGSSYSTSQPPLPNFVSGGTVHVRGGVATPSVDLSYDRGTSVYQAANLPLGSQIFAGGEILSIDGDGDGDGDTVPAFHGTVRAPQPLIVTAPTDFAAWDYAIAWSPSDATRLLISLVASKADNRWIQIECVVDDGLGRFELPRALTDQLPPPPRDLQLSVSRDQLIHTAGPSGVILHAGYAINLMGAE